MYNFSDLRTKEVINISDGKRLGYICDINIDEHTGMVNSVVVPKNKGFFWNLWKSDDYVIPWSGITTVGEDIIIVNVRF